METRSGSRSGGKCKGKDAARSLDLEVDEIRKDIADLKELVKLALRRGEGSENEEHADRMAQSLKEEPGDE